jgi:hypothetical protein
MADESRPEQRISLSFDVFAVSQRLGAYLDRALADTGIRPAEYAVYSLMLEAGPRTPSELAAMLGTPPSTLSTYLGAMLARGDARRIPNPSDGRSVRVSSRPRRGSGWSPAVHLGAAGAQASPGRPLDEVRAVRASSARRSSGPIWR